MQDFLLDRSAAYLDDETRHTDIGDFVLGTFLIENRS